MASQIQQIKKVHYPLAEAIEKAMQQNLNRDKRLGLVSEPFSNKELDIYREEATTVLKNDGENYLPEYPDTEHICVQQA
jgi:hypothetical protein